MTHKEFLLLTDPEQAEIARLRGVRVADYEDGNFRHVLYQLDSFYLEGKFEVITGKG